MDVCVKTNNQSSIVNLGLGRLLVLIALSFVTGCATFRDIQQDMSQWGLRSDKKDSWRRSPDDELDMMGERRPSRIVTRDFQPRNFMSTMRVITALGEDQATAQRDFDEGRRLYDQAAQRHEQGELKRAAPIFHKAANRFRVAAARWPDSALEEDSLFLQGEAFFFANDYVLANRAYEGLISRFTGSAYFDQVQARRFAIAQYWLKTTESGASVLGIHANSALPTLGAAAEGRRILHRIRLDDPTGRLADDATMALGAAHFRAGNYQDAADAFDDLRKNYAASPHQFNAHLFQLKSLLATYAGADYDGTPLEKAEQLMRTMIRQFPNEVEQHKSYLATEGNRIRNMLAERDYVLGQYYESQGENRAAKMYYAAVAERFNDTELSKKATERIAAIADEPDEPVSHVGWIESVFPDPKSATPLIPTNIR